MAAKKKAKKAAPAKKRAPAKKKDFTLAQKIEKAMGEAVLEAYADGITDDEQILVRKFAARDKVRAEHAE